MSISRVYIDIEYDNESNIIEFSAIEVKDYKIENILHRFVLPQKHVQWCLHETFARYSHCISSSVIRKQGIKLSQLHADLQTFINEINSDEIIIKGHGTDVNKQELIRKFPFLTTFDLNYIQVNLPPWSERKYGAYHIATHYMKQFSQIMSCCSSNHTLTFKTSDKINHTRIAKNFYGFHCALFDAIELAMYEKTIPIYCCDEHFTNVFSANYLVFVNI